MKICYVGQFARSSIGEPEIAIELENLGHEVERLEEHDVDIEQVESACKDRDLLLMAKFRVKGTMEEKYRLFERLRQNGVKIVTWVFDIYWGL